MSPPSASWLEYELNKTLEYCAKISSPPLHPTIFSTEGSFSGGQLSLLFASGPHVLREKIDSVIDRADLALCLTSKYKYVRERKKYSLEYMPQCGNTFPYGNKL